MNYKEQAIKFRKEYLANQEATRQTIRIDEIAYDKLMAMKSIYPEWQVGVSLIVGEVVRYQEKLYKVIQAHKTQADWLPTVKSLFLEIAPPEVIPLWKQPTGAHDAYQIGAKVIFNGKVYQSTINANVWSPTAYPQGWKLI
jgi:hypothetical protein